MQSESQRTAPAAPVLLPPLGVGFAAVVMAVLPPVGYLSSTSGIFLDVARIELYPTPWHHAAVAAATLLNAWLLFTRRSFDQAQPFRLGALSFVAGMSVLYGAVMAPAIPVILIGCVVMGLGFLAMAPYWACMGLFLLVPACWREWRAMRRSPQQAFLIAVPCALLVPAMMVAFEASQHGARDNVQAMARALLDRDEAAQERLAAALRREGWQRRPSVDRDDDDYPRHRTTWYAPRRTDFEAIHDRVLGPEPGLFAPRPLHDPNSALLVDQRVSVTRDAIGAVAAVDLLIEARCVASEWDREAVLDIRLPHGAVASSLSLWIDGEERPAAFASARRVEAVYEAVVRTSRDPALLCEVEPGLLQLRLFPVPRDGSPMRARVGITAPYERRDGSTVVLLPRIVASNVRQGADRAVLTVDGGDERSLRAVPDWLVPIDAPVAATAATVKDADGPVVQRLSPVADWQGRLVLAVDGSASCARPLGRRSALLRLLPADREIELLIARGTSFVRRTGRAGDAELQSWADSIPSDGGVDALPMLRAAFQSVAGDPRARLLWVHGEQPRPLFRWPHLVDRVPPGRCFARAMSRGHNTLRGERGFGRALIDLPPEVPVATFMRLGAAGAPAFVRTFTRPPTPPAGIASASDHIARLWAAQRAYERAAAGDVDGATELAARYRLVTAGAGAVVLENRAQYEASRLEPGAPLGREPPGPIGQAVPEPATYLLVGSGALAMFWMYRRRGRRYAARPACNSARS